MSNILSDGGIIIYIRQSNSNTQYSLNQTNWTNISWPCTITNTNTNAGFVKIVFNSDITLNNVNSYFICNSDKIQFGSESLKNNGSRPIINIDNVTNYLGFIQNYVDDTEVSYNDIYIFNLFINSENSTLAAYAGWVGQVNFCTLAINNYVINCSSNGSINNRGGGILGSSAGSTYDNYESNLKIIGCSSTGNIAGEFSGGILGDLCGANGGSNVTCRYCWSTGVISGNRSGGIVGSQSGWVSGSSGSSTIRILNCYSEGTISGDQAGGIAGAYFGSSPGSGAQADAQITNCYSTGNIIGDNSGGIGGGVETGGQYNCIATISNCYSTGNINSSGNSGGIYGMRDTYGTSGETTIINCYTTGTTDDTKGYIVGDSQTIPTNCYSEADNGSSGWSNTNANTVLLEYPNPKIGIVWISSNTNQPYELNMGYNQYTINNITLSPPALVKNYSTTIGINNSTINSIVSNKSYTILYKIKDSIEADLLNNITINLNTGRVSATSDTEIGTYTIYIRNNETYGYSINQMTLTVQSTNPVPCLTENTKVLTPEGYVNINKLKIGDYVMSSDNKIVQIKYIFYSIVEGNYKTYPCIIPKDSIAKNYPSETFTISRNHMIKYNNIWIHPGSHFQLDTSLDLIKYYHIKLENYITDHLIINDGVVVESLGNIISDNISLPIIDEYSIECVKRFDSMNNNKINIMNKRINNRMNDNSLKVLRLINRKLK
jgi:hypothetical protein